MNRLFKSNICEESSKTVVRFSRRRVTNGVHDLLRDFPYSNVERIKRRNARKQCPRANRQETSDNQSPECGSHCRLVIRRVEEKRTVRETSLPHDVKEARPNRPVKTDLPVTNRSRRIHRDSTALGLLNKRKLRISFLRMEITYNLYSTLFFKFI